MPPAADAPLEVWAEEQVRHSAAKLTQCISATGLVKERPGFATRVQPAKGSCLASTTSADPDYFFHWLRDSVAVMDAVRVLIRCGEDVEGWTRRFNEFVTFSLGLRNISGASFLKDHPGFRDKMDPSFLQFVRPDDEIAAVEGERVLGEARYNVDGTFEFIRWNRPQHDGPAARALTCMRFWNEGLVTGGAKTRLADLIRGDLDYTARFCGEPCFDIWEEDLAQHYYTTLVQYAALEEGARWAKAECDAFYAAQLQEKGRWLSDLLNQFWSPRDGLIRSRILEDGSAGGKALDFAVILGVLHAGLAAGAHRVQAPHVRATFQKLEELFVREYALNRGRESGVVFGRYKGDTYVSGGAYYFSTFGAAEYYYRLAAAVPLDAANLIAKGDAILSRTREFIPVSGDLTEQLDQTTGAQTSAPDLSWSYACFITAWDARQAAVAKSGGADA